MSRQRFAKFGLAIIAAAALWSMACSPDLDIDTARAPDLQVQIQFREHHQAVTGRWTGISVSTSPDVPASLQNLPGTIPAPGVPLPFQDVVVPTQTVNFPVQPDLLPGTWDITVTAQEGGQTVFTVVCEDVIIPALLAVDFAVGLTVIEGEEGCVPSEGSFSEPIPPHRDLAVQPFTVPSATFPPTVPPTIEQGTLVSIDVTVQNLSGIPEEFTIGLTDTPAAGSSGLVTSQNPTVQDLAVNDTATRIFQWNTGGASLGLHTLRASVPAVTFETITGNNFQTVPVNVVNRPDVAVTGVTVPGPVIAGGTYTVAVDLKNNGQVPKTITVSLEDMPPGGGTPVPLGSSPPISLGATGAAGDTQTYPFPWNTAGIPAGQHRLTARIPVLSSDESNTGNNSDFADVVVEAHDVEAVSLTAPAAAVIGGTPVAVTASIRNNGNIDEGSVTVTLTAQPPGGGAPVVIATPAVSLNAGITAPVNFTWDTACIAPPGNYTLTATVSVANDSDTTNDTASTANPVTLSVDHELSIAIVTNPGTVTGGTGVGFVVNLINNNSVGESGIDVDFTDNPVDPDGPGGPLTAPLAGAVQRDPRLPVSLACGETKELVFNWITPSFGASGDHNMITTITTAIPGDNPADNTDTVTVTVQ